MSRPASMSPAVPAGSGVPVPAPPPSALPGRLTRVLTTAPTAVPLAVAGYSVVAMAALLAGAFRPVLVLPVGLLAALGCVLLGGWEAAPADREQRVCDALVLVLAGAFAVLNVHYVSQDIVVTRDPGVYATAAAWLVHHPSLHVAVHPALFGLTNSQDWAAAGYGPTPHPGELYAQGLHLLPALGASFGWLFGIFRVVDVSPLLGGAALLAIYGFGRRLARPRTVLLVVALLAGTLPELAFTRDVYTEPLDQLLLFGALSLLWRAQTSGRVRDAALAGLLFGATVLSRIDGYLTLDLIAVALVALLAATPPGERAGRLRWTTALGVSALVPAVLALRDAQTLSYGYYISLHQDTFRLLELGAAVVVLGALLVAACWRGRWWPRAQRRSAGWLPAAGAGAVLLLAAGFASRPLWHTSRSPGQLAGPLIGALQAAARQPVHPSRTYAEHTVAWVTWYIGLPAALLALAGLAVLVHRVLAGRAPRTLPFLTLVVLTGAFYFYNPQITPDQIWASRRFVPVIIPGLLLAAAFLLDRLLGVPLPPAARTDSARGAGVRYPAPAADPAPALAPAQARHLAPQARRPRRPAARWAGYALAVPVLLVLPLRTTAPLARVRQYVPQIEDTEQLCKALPSHALVVYPDGFGFIDTPTERSFCGHPTVLLPPGVIRTPTLARLRAAADAQRRPLVAVTTAPLPGRPALDLVSSASIQTWQSTLTGPPQHPAEARRAVYVLGVARDGSLVPRPVR